MRKPSGPIQHVVIIVKENHTFDNYFGRFPGVDGDGNLAAASDPPSTDHPHEHAAWLKRANGAAKEQYGQANLPNYCGHAHGYITALKGSKNNVSADHFAKDAAAGKLPAVSWVYGPKGLSEHPVEPVKAGQKWTADQVDAVVKGGLWRNTVIFITW